MKPKRVLLLGEFKYRDLAGLSLIKVFLENLGSCEVFLLPNVSSVEEKLYLRKYKPHLVVLPRFTNQNHVARANALRRCGIGVAVVPAEGTAFLEELRLQVAGKFVDLSPVDLFFVWNRPIWELIQAHRTIRPECCVVAGVPRFDFYHPRFRKLLMSKEEFCRRYQMDSTRPIITWATNFGFVRLAGKPAETAEFIQRYHSEGLSDSAVYRDVPGHIERELESREVLTEGALRLAKEFPESYVVIKVHPAEMREWYEEKIAASGLQNVRMVAREYIWDVLHATTVHCHRSCTTAIEAWFLGKPTVDFQFAPREWHVSREMLPGEDAAFSLDVCLDRVRYYLNGGRIPLKQQSARSEIIGRFCGGVDGRSAERHAQAIHEWLMQSKKEPAISGWTRHDLFLAATSPIKSFVGLEIHHSLGRWLRGEAQDGREKYFTQDDVRQWDSNIRQFLNGGGLR